MRDHDIRSVLLAELEARHVDDASTRIVQEMGVWSGSVRVDIATINGELQGFELKSDRDTLERLPLQAEIYSQVFDRVILVVGGKHAEQASKMIPRWWGITVASVQGNALLLEEKVAPCLNPELNLLQVARLLWKQEALALLAQRGAVRGFRSKPVSVLHQRIVDVFEPDEMRHEVRVALKARAEWLR